MLNRTSSADFTELVHLSHTIPSTFKSTSITAAHATRRTPCLRDADVPKRNAIGFSAVAGRAAVVNVMTFAGGKRRAVLRQVQFQNCWGSASKDFLRGIADQQGQRSARRAPLPWWSRWNSVHWAPLARNFRLLGHHSPRCYRTDCTPVQ